MKVQNYGPQIKDTRYHNLHQRNDQPKFREKSRRVWLAENRRSVCVYPLRVELPPSPSSDALNRD